MAHLVTALLIIIVFQTNKEDSTTQTQISELTDEIRKLSREISAMKKHMQQPSERLPARHHDECDEETVVSIRL